MIQRRSHEKSFCNFLSRLVIGTFVTSKPCFAAPSGSIQAKISQSKVSKSQRRYFMGCRPNQRMERTRVAPVKDSNCARKSLAQFELWRRRPRAVHLGRYASQALNA